jgi:hypothetical protein
MLKDIFSKNKGKISRTSHIAETNLSIERMKDAEALERRRLVVQRELEEAMEEYAAVTGYKQLKARKFKVGSAPNDWRES